MRKQIYLVMLVIPFLGSMLILPSASAETNCRQIARDIQSKGIIASQSDPSGASVLKLFTDGLTSYPECKSELSILYQWNQAKDPLAKFPFPKSGDPKNYPLGPISWWWDVIYNSLFGGSVLLMFLFGWELFLAPIPFLFVLITIPFRILGEFFKRRRKYE